jgi:Flp pilus assembly protein TadB
VSDLYPEDGGYAEAGGAHRVTSRPDVSETSVGQLVSQVTSNLSTLMRQELELAKAEVRQEASKAGKAAGMLGGAGGAGYFALLFASLALMFLLDTFMPIALAALIVAVLYAIVGAVLYSRGRKQMKSVNPKPEQTVDTLKEDVQWAKTRNR